MIETLICNFNTKWDFVHLCQCHGLDLLLDKSVVVWDLVSGGYRDNDPLGWPHPVTLQTAPKAIEELAGTPGWPPKYIILICGLQSDAEWGHLATLTSSLPEAKSRKYIFSCSDAGRPKDPPTNTSFIVVSEPEPLLQFYSFRILLELLQKNPEILFPRGMESQDLHLDLKPVKDTLRDQVAPSWFPVADWLHTHCEEISKPRDKILAAYSESIKAFLKQSKEFSEQEVELPPHENMPKPSPPSARFFFTKSLVRDIRKCCDEFYESPEDEPEKASVCDFLRESYRQIKQEREKVRRDLSAQRSERFKEIENMISLSSLGLSQESVGWLQNRMEEVGDSVAMVQKRLKELLDRIPINQGHKALKCRALGGLAGELEIPILEEDRAVSLKRDEACRLAERLAGHRWFYTALGFSFGISLLPPAARWWGGGPAIFSEPLDLAWIGAFVGLFCGASSFVALWRRRALRKALFSRGKLVNTESVDSTGTSRELLGFGLKTAMEIARDRHMEALGAAYSYLRVQEALTNIHRLMNLLRTRLTKMESEIKACEGVSLFLKRQLEYYRDHFSSLGEYTGPSDFARPELDLHVSGWLKESLKAVDPRRLHAGKGSIEVFDNRFPSKPERGSFESDFLQNEARLALSEAERKP